MANVIIYGSRYFLIIFFALFVYQAFKMDSDIKEKKKNSRHTVMTAFVLIIHCVAFLVIGTSVYINNEEEGLANVIIIAVSLLIYYLCFNIIAPLIYENIHRGMVAVISMFLCVGFIEITRLDFDKAVKQLIILLVATVLFFILPYAVNKVKNLDRHIWLYGGIGLVLLLAVLLFASTDNGAKLAIGIGGFSFQPLEFVKILFVLYIAALFNSGTDRKNVIISMVSALVYIIILVLSKDLGSAVILLVVYLFMLYAGTRKKIYMLGGAAILAGGSFLAFKMFSHVRVRVFAWLDPWSDIDGGGYQITQSLFAIGTGGWIGLGIYQGMPYKIPEVSQDFIFSAIAEEMGILFAILLILLSACMFLSIMRISMMQTRVFEKLIVLGLGCSYAVQVFLTIGGAMKMIPSTGVTLPLVSSGGSSILASMVVFGLIEAMYIKAVKFRKEYGIDEKI